jgi:hypothetical protein
MMTGDDRGVVGVMVVELRAIKLWRRRKTG